MWAKISYRDVIIKDIYAGAGAASNSAAAATIAATSTSATASAPTGTTNIKNHTSFTITYLTKV